MLFSENAENEKGETMRPKKYPCRKQKEEKNDNEIQERSNGQYRDRIMNGKKKTHREI